MSLMAVVRTTAFGIHSTSGIDWEQLPGIVVLEKLWKIAKVIIGVAVGMFAVSAVAQQTIGMIYYPDTYAIARAYSQVVFPTLIIGALIGGVLGYKWWWQHVLGSFVIVLGVITLAYFTTSAA